MRNAVRGVYGLVLSIAGMAASQASPPEATAYQMTVDHAGVTSSGGTVALQASPLWTVTFTAPTSYPLIAGGIVYVTFAGPPGTGTQLQALDAKTGDTVWVTDIPGMRPWSNATLDNGMIFVVSYEGVLSSFNAATGAPGISVQLPGQYAFSSPPTAAGGVVYTGGAGVGGTVYAVTESTGAVQWTASVQNGDNSSPALSGSGVYVSYTCPQVYDFDPMTGAQLWHYSGPCEGGGGKTAAYAAGKLYVRGAFGPPTGNVFDASSGALLSNFSAGPIPAVSATQVLYLNSGTLEARDLTAAGTLLWSFVGDGGLSSAPIVVDQYVIIGSSTGKLYALDAQNGASVWQGNVGNPIPAPDEQNVSQPLTGLAIADGVLVVPAGNTLVAYSLLGPAAPTALTAAAGPGQVTLNWTATAGADSYQVFVGTVSGGEASPPKLTGITGTSAIVTGLTIGTQYFFTVKALSGALLSFASNEATATPAATPQPPAGPTALMATAGNAQVMLSWTGASSASSYNVYQGTTAGGESSTAALTGISGTTTTITGLANSTTYYFIIKAVTPSGLSAASNEVSAAPAAAMASASSGGGGGGGGIDWLTLALLSSLIVWLRRARESWEANGTTKPPSRTLSSASAARLS